VCSVLTYLVFHIRKIKRLRSVQVHLTALVYSLIAFSYLFRWLLFEEAFIKAMKLSEFSEHSRGRQCAFVSLAALLLLAVEYTRIEVYVVYRWAVAFFRFFDLFCWSVMITSIRGSIHQGQEAFSEHSRGRQPSYSWNYSRFRSIDRWLTYRK